MTAYFILFAFLCIVSRTAAIANDYNPQITIIVNQNHHLLNHNEMIDAYLDTTNDDITVFPPMSDANTFCQNLELFFRNTSIVSSSSQHILFMDSLEDFKSFMNECNDNNNIDIEIISHPAINHHDATIFHIQAKPKLITRRQLTSSMDLGSWSTSSTKLPSNNYDMATFIYNNTIYLFGGRFSSHNKQIIEYDLTTDTFSDVQLSALSVTCEGDAPFYTQIENIAYWAGKTTISRYDLSTKQLYPNIISGVNNTMNDLCLASHKHLLFLVGGSYDTNKGKYPALRKVQIYNLSSQMWLDGAPAMNRPRGGLTCIVHPEVEMLYAIGGANRLYPTLNYENITEKIHVDDNVLNNEWIKPKPNGLYVAVINARAVVYKEYIVVMGGYCYFYPRNLCPGEVNVLQLINVMTDELFVGPSLPQVNQQFGAVYSEYDSRIYVFGGFKKDIYSYLTIATDAPTNAPSSAPTTKPTISPTTYRATNNPTYGPTKVLIVASTESTAFPSKTATVLGTVHPTASPADAQSSKSGSHQIIVIVLIIFVSLFGLLFVIFLLLFVRKRSEMNSLLMEQASSNVEVPYVELTDGDDDDDHPDEGHMVPTKRSVAM